MNKVIVGIGFLDGFYFRKQLIFSIYFGKIIVIFCNCSNLGSNVIIFIVFMIMGNSINGMIMIGYGC